MSVTTFKVGDRVRLKAEYRDLAAYGRLTNGEAQTIGQILGSGDNAGAEIRETGTRVFLTRLELAESAIPALIDPAKKYRTRDGREVLRILCTDCPGDLPVVALVEGRRGEGTYYPVRRYIDGSACGTSPLTGERRESDDDLIEVKPEYEAWLNIHKTDVGCGFYIRHEHTRQEADRVAGSNRIACLHLKFTEGEGL